ncbi:hypothetical protein FDI40_gp086 [Agrobacterium phage Atu_ph07]|uniref:RNA ligase domain-containing protein n=1 Tax=Agrobacterium phage Atu_ph07 TaxID=2024264 RepID=A0A2L0UZD2_9CAUD|nr:hypothetical protein FDI40_gp086 [Agrobacterium phage Atu_ph07]AUZ94893.1 hypothetical protein [Agrobacterium phage Atu_ph07]
MNNIQRHSYPRTFHLPWSEGATSDDKKLRDCSSFVGKEVIVTEKRDGENTTGYADGYVHARSVDGTGKEYQSFFIKKWREVSFRLPDTLRVCGENLYAKHSISYDNLTDYFEMFGVYDDTRRLHWDECLLWAEELNLTVVPVLYRGIWDEKKVKSICNSIDTTAVEGIVVSSVETFDVSDFKDNVAKFVRKNHVQTDQHWTKNWTPNKLIGKDN